MRSNVRENAMAYYLTCRADEIKELLNKLALEKQQCKKSDRGKK